MNKFIKYIFTLLGVILVASGCKKNSDGVQESGELKFLPFAVQSEMISVGDNTTKVDNSASNDILVAHIFEVTIYDAVSDEVVQHYSNHLDIPATIVLETGSYIAEVRSADINSQLPLNSTVAFDKPQYGADYPFEIHAGETTEISITAKPITAAVRISYSDTFKHLFPCANQGETYFTTMQSSHGAEIVFKKDETRTAYFKITGKGMALLYNVTVVRQLSDGTLESFTASEPQYLIPEGEEIKAGYIYNTTITVEGE